MSESLYIPPFHIEKTLLYTYNELSTLTPLTTDDMLDTTLNHKYNILANQKPSNQPQIKYFGIGIKGFVNLDLGQLAAPYPPKPTNMDLYEPIPLRIVPVTNDLSAEERAKYRIRVKKNINGNDYWCYYLKLIDYQSTKIKIIETNLETHTETEITDLQSEENLNPTPDAAAATGNINYTRERIVCADATITITGNEVVEVINILKNGNLNYARVSEIGLYSGEDLNNSVEGVNYTESIYTQLAYHMTFTGTDMSDPGAILTRNIRLSSASAYLV